MDKAAEGDAPSDVQATEDDANALLDLVRGLLEKADLDVDVSTSEVSGRYVTIKLDGSGRGSPRGC